MAEERCSACQGSGKELFSNKNCIVCGGSGRRFVHDFNSNTPTNGKVIGCHHLLIVGAVIWIFLLIKCV